MLANPLIANSTNSSITNDAFESYEYLYHSNKDSYDSNCYSMWLLISIIAYSLLALASIVDKFLISRKELKPIAYAFYVGVASIFVFLLAPFGLKFPSASQFFLSLFIGVLLNIALIFLYKTLHKGEASRVMPVVGSLVPVFSFIISRLFLGERLGVTQYIAFAFLVFGSALMAFGRSNHRSRKWILGAIFTGFLFSVSWILTKVVYFHQPFISGFIWIRLGAVLGALALLVSSENRRVIFESFKTTKIRIKKIFLLSLIFGPFATFLLNYAVSLSSVTLVNALEGLRYSFLFIFTVIISHKFPHILAEEKTKQIIFYKIFAVALIVGGLYLLVSRG